MSLAGVMIVPFRRSAASASLGIFASDKIYGERLGGDDGVAVGGAHAPLRQLFKSLVSLIFGGMMSGSIALSPHVLTLDNAGATSAVKRPAYIACWVGSRTVVGSLSR